MTKTTQQFGLIACALAILTPISAVSTSADKRAKATITGPEKAVAGKPFSLTVSIDIEPGYHIQANNAKDPYIPTTIVINGGDTFKAGAPSFPESMVIESFGEKLRVFDGKVTVRIPITFAAWVKGGTWVNLTVKYQACNDMACDPPAEAAAFAEIKVEAPPKAQPTKKPTPPKKKVRK